MHFLDVSLPTEIENIALDEALLETAEQDPQAIELLRLWEPTRPVVVIGRSSPIDTEVNLEFCAAERIDVVRRSSGGQSVVNGPGCLLYGLLLDYRKRPELRMLEHAHSFVMIAMQRAIASLGIETRISGTSDLTLEDPATGAQRKVSGNALRCRRNWMLYHGTMLCNADLTLISACLGRPKRMPPYRESRSHSDFLTQLPTDTTKLRDAIRREWSADQEVSKWPRVLTEQLVREKYKTREWNHKI